jgi:hypothetical protein
VGAAGVATGVPSSIGLATFAKGEAFAQTDPVTALSAYERAVALVRQSGCRIFIAIFVPKIAALLAGSGDPIKALQSFQQILESSSGSRDVVFVSQGLGNLVVLFERLGQPIAAATLNAAVMRIVDAHALVPELTQTMSRVRGRLGEAAFDEANRRGAAMPIHHANDFALAEIAQALATAAAT